jgi:single-strand DNA-binding protein
MLPTISGEFGVVKEPEIKFTDKGAAWAKIRCSAKDRKRDAQGNWTDADPLYINIIVGNGAENLIESVLPGDSIIVTGRLKMREYEVDGQKKQEYQIAADTVGVSMRWNTAKTPRMIETQSSIDSAVAVATDAFDATVVPF